MLHADNHGQNQKEGMQRNSSILGLNEFIDFV